MTYAGAEGDTERQMAQALHFHTAAPNLHGALNALDQQLANREDMGRGADNEPFRLHTVIGRSCS